MIDLRKDIDFTFRKEFVNRGVRIARGEWQAMRDERPQTKVVELYDVAIRAEVPMEPYVWQDICRPNLPWAEDHFQERVGGDPLNPGEQYQNWPWYKQGVEEHKPSGHFSHTYMERMWAGNIEPRPVGIRYQYGDLKNLIHLLDSRPMTRQAYLPIWFAEDLRAADVERQRVPCSLGYHFLVVPTEDHRRKLNVTYHMRSCDFYRYLWDDVYMAGRLMQWVREKLPHNLLTGELNVKIANLHIFDAEFSRIKREYEEEVAQRMGAIL